MLHSTAPGCRSDLHSRVCEANVGNPVALHPAAPQVPGLAQFSLVSLGIRSSIGCVFEETGVVSRAHGGDVRPRDAVSPRSVADVRRGGSMHVRNKPGVGDRVIAGMLSLLVAMIIACRGSSRCSHASGRRVYLDLHLGGRQRFAACGRQLLCASQQCERPGLLRVVGWRFVGHASSNRPSSMGQDQWSPIRFHSRVIGFR